MKKVVAFVGSARHGHTLMAAEDFMAHLEAYGDVETEVVRLSDHRLGYCRGCKNCFGKGEEFCPLKDDRDTLIAKMDEADGVVFATPNFTFGMSGLMKSFLDRLGFVCHRPRFHGKAFTSIVVQGFYGGNAIMKNLNFVAHAIGFETVKGSCSAALDPMTAKEAAKRDARLAAQAKRFHEALARDRMPKPSLIDVAVFRAGRAKVLAELGPGNRDFDYYASKGWFDSDYFYPTKVGALKRAIGRIIENRVLDQAEVRPSA